MSDFPVFLCQEQRTQSGGVIWAFPCPHCRKHHIHGAGPGHRAAHCCRPNSPFARGYILALSDDMTPRGRADKRQQGETQARAETMNGDLPRFEMFCEQACIKLWGKPDHSTARVLRWDGLDAYSAKTFDRDKKVWFDFGADWGGSTLELVAHSRRQPKPEKLRGKAFFDTWAEARQMGLVPDGPPEWKPNGKGNEWTPPAAPKKPDNIVDLDEHRRNRDEEIERLAGLDDIDYEQRRKESAKTLNMRPTELDRHVKNKRPKSDKFSMTDAGLHLRNEWIAQAFEIVALARDTTSSDQSVAWSTLVRFRNPDGATCEAPVSKAALVREPNVALAALADHGLNIKCTKAAKEGLVEYLAAAEPKERLILVRRAGWSSDARTFALLDEIMGGSRR